MKTYIFTNVVTGETFEYTSKKLGCDELGLNPRTIDLTKESYGEAYNALPLEERITRANPRSNHKGFSLEVVEVESKEISGEEEKKAKFVEHENGYTIYGRKTEINVSKDEIRKIIDLYCIRRLTIELTAVEMNMLREELTLILNALSITHTSIPFIKDDIESKTVNEMVEDTLIAKKKAYVQKLRDEEFKSMKKELDTYRKADYLYNKLFDKMVNVQFNPIIFKDFKRPEYTNEATVVISLADVHSGAYTDNYYNKYSTPIMRDRFGQFTLEAIKEIERVNPSRIIVLNLGDSIEGGIHESGRIATDCDCDTATENVTEEIGNLLLTVSKYAPVDFYQTMGNHGRRFRDKSASILQENVENTINWGLKLLFKHVENINIHKNKSLVEFKIYDKNIAIHHGENFKNDQKMSSNRNRPHRMVFKGHDHKFDISTVNELEVITVGTMMGSNDWSSEKELYSKPVQLITTIDKDWNVKHTPVYLD